MNPSRWHRLWQVPWQAARQFVRDDCTMWAAAIAFYSVLSLAPGLFLVGAVLSRVFDDVDMSRRVVAVVAEFLPPQAVPTVERVSDALTFHGALLIVAIPGLAWIATQVVHALQVALNVVFARRDQGHGLWISRLKSFLVLIVGATGFAGVLLLNTAVTILEPFSDTLALPMARLALTRILSGAAIPVMTFLVFHLIYRLLPSGRCKRWPAATGAAVAAPCWLVARSLFGEFIEHSPAFGIVTGTLTSALAFLMSIYTGAALVLFGAEIAAILNGDRSA